MAYPNLRQSIWLVVLFWITQLVLGLIIYAVQTILGESFRHENLLTGVLTLVVYYLFLRYVFRRTDRTWKDLSQMVNTDFDWRVWPCVAISIVGLGMVLLELDKVVIRLIPMTDFIQDIFNSEFGRKTSYSSAVFRAVFVAPSVEELLYRGIIFTGLLAHKTRNRAIFWSAFLFGVGHLNPWQFPPALLYGFVFAWWYIRTGSLWPALVGHALNNFIAVTTLHFEIPYFEVAEDFNVVVFNPWWWTGAGMILAALGLWWFYVVSKDSQSTAPAAIETGYMPGDGN